MRDLKSYFRSNVQNGSTNAHGSTYDASSSITRDTDQKRQFEDCPRSARAKRRSGGIRRSSRTDSIDSAVSREAVEEDSSEEEWNRKLNARKKQKRKSSIKKKLDSSVKSTDENSEKGKSDVVTRDLKGVLLEDCSNSPLTSIVSDEKRKRDGRKRRKSESDQSQLWLTESSDDVFESPFRERPKRTYSRKSDSRDTKEANNLFNYFAKAEKSDVQKERALENSPIDCMKKVKVTVQIHSPPRAPPSKAKRSKTNDFSPVVKLVRTREVKKLDFDLIEVVGVEEVNPQETKSIREPDDDSLKPEECPSIEEDENSDSSVVFRHAKRATVSVRKLVLENSDSESSSEQQSESKKNSLLQKSDSVDSDCDDPIWRMRVQFAPKTAIQSKPKKSTLKVATENFDSSVEEEDVKEKRTRNKILNVAETSKSKVKKGDEPLKQPKLAPLFCQQQKKKFDNIVNIDDEAKKQFLSSGLPEVMKKKFEEQKNVHAEEETLAGYKFPTVTHVQQKSDQFVWNLSKVDLTLRVVEEDVRVPNYELFASLINRGTDARSDSEEKLDFDVKDEVAALKKLEPAVNVGDYYASVRRLHQEAESTGSICWTDKYKPSIYDDLVGNTTNLTKLREWIESHKRLKVSHSDYDGSSEEFMDSDDSTRNSRMKDNVAILAGPPGCGKTCAVYMLAKELGFQVLEVNAASNRDGKRLLGELLEATQSHQVKRETIFEKAANDKKSSRKLKKKKKSKEEKCERKTMSLILIEDADILFENYDEGFVSALNTLAKESKRPLVFTVNDINCPHLFKYKNNLILPFEYPSRPVTNVWLKLIALTEGVKLSDAVLIDLFHIAGLDVRKSLLQLQMLISSKLCRSVLDGENLFYQDWCRRLVQCEKRPTLPDTTFVNYDDDLFSPKKGAEIVEAPELPKEESSDVPVISQSDRETNRKLLDDHAKFMDIVTLLGHFESNQEENIHPCGSEAPHEDLLCADIHSVLKQNVFSSFKESKSSPVSFGDYYGLIRKNFQIKSVYQSTLSNLKVPIHDRYAKYCDFLPTLRNITRLERLKQSNQQKKTSRFFSYLKSVNIHVNDQEMEFLRESLM